MADRNEVRYYGSQVRNGLLSVYNARGNAVGMEFSRRYVWEIGEVVAEIHGREASAAMLYELADGVVARMPLKDIPWTEPASIVVRAPAAAAIVTSKGQRQLAALRAFLRSPWATPSIVAAIVVVWWAFHG